jgi:hypothetical protein
VQQDSVAIHAGRGVVGPKWIASAWHEANSGNPAKSLFGDSKMYTIRLRWLFGTLALFAACNFSAHAQEVKTVFVIAMENHNWTQPANQSTRWHSADLPEPQRAVHQQPR